VQVCLFISIGVKIAACSLNGIKNSKISRSPGARNAIRKPYKKFTSQSGLSSKVQVFTQLTIAHLQARVGPARIQINLPRAKQKTNRIINRKTSRKQNRKANPKINPKAVLTQNRPKIHRLPRKAKTRAANPLIKPLAWAALGRGRPEDARDPFPGYFIAHFLSFSLFRPGCRIKL
jgi:hypothetical protein